MNKGNRKYLIAIIIGVLLTPTAVSEAFAERQYKAMGGEWLLIPLALLVVFLFKTIKEFIVITLDELAEEDEEL